jgi:hypothetical protein
MMTQCLEEYITMTTDDSGVCLPAGLMSCGHHNNYMPRAVHRTMSILDDLRHWALLIDHTNFCTYKSLNLRRNSLMKMLLITNNKLPNVFLQMT